MLIYLTVWALTILGKAERIKIRKDIKRRLEACLLNIHKTNHKVETLPLTSLIGMAGYQIKKQKTSALSLRIISFLEDSYLR